MSKEDLIFCGKIVGAGAAIGILTGFGLSFTALPLFMIGGIVASILAVLLAAFGAYCTFRKGELDYKTILGSLCFCAISVAIGVGLGAATNAIFPGVMVGMGPTALAGLLIGGIALFAGLLTEVFIVEPIVEKINKYIISPTIETIKKWSSSKENQQEMTH